MKYPELAEQALALNEKDRAALALTLMDTLTPGAEISDEEAIRRDEELENKTVTPLTHEEFIRRAQEDRRK